MPAGCGNCDRSPIALDVSPKDLVITWHSRTGRARTASGNDVHQFFPVREGQGERNIQLALKYSF
jgi:hypothetical protein